MGKNAPCTEIPKRSSPAEPRIAPSAIRSMASERVTREIAQIATFGPYYADPGSYVNPFSLAETGIAPADDSARYAAPGADAVLVGEALVRTGDPRAGAAAIVAAGAAREPQP